MTVPLGAESAGFARSWADAMTRGLQLVGCPQPPCLDPRWLGVQVLGAQSPKGYEPLDVVEAGFDEPDESDPLDSPEDPDDLLDEPLLAVLLEELPEFLLDEP